MRYPYFIEAKETQSSFTGLLLLVLMLAALMLAPKLAFAMNEDDPLPRYLLSPQDVGLKVAEKLQEEGYGEVIEATVQVEDPNTVYGSDEPMEVVVKGINANKKSRRWSANIIFVNGEKVLTALPMKGRFDEMIELPVLEHSLSTGQEIAEADIIVKSFPAHYRRAGVVVDASELIGKSARRNISDSRPIRAHEISSPIVVKKNGLVTIHYNSDNLTITTTGQVMTDAAVGDVVAVKNLNSDKKIRAVIQDAKTANVLPLTQTSAKLGGVHDVH